MHHHFRWKACAFVVFFVHIYIVWITRILNISTKHGTLVLFCNVEQKKVIKSHSVLRGYGEHDWKVRRKRRMAGKTLLTYHSKWRWGVCSFRSSTDSIVRWDIGLVTQCRALVNAKFGFLTKMEHLKDWTENRDITDNDSINRLNTSSETSHQELRNSNRRDGGLNIRC